MITVKKNSSQPIITEMPSMLKPKEEFALVLGADKKLYAIGGYNN